MPFPIDRHHERSYPDDWQGEVFICDIDRTYLSTRFSSLQGMARIPFEFAIDKREIEGMVPLLKEIRRGPEETSRSTPLYFISASPSQLRRVIERKMLLDGLEYDGTTFKDWGRVLLGLRPSRLWEQLGFKLTALLEGRLDLPSGAVENLIGDDLEADALCFALYADLLARRLDEATLRRVLVEQGVGLKDADALLGLRRGLGSPAPVKRALIRLERCKNAEPLRDYFPQLVGCSGALQLALCLWEQGSLSLAGLLRVARDLRRRGASGEVLAAQLQDACRRTLLGKQRAVELTAALIEAGLVPADVALPEADPLWQAAWERDAQAPWTPARYLEGRWRWREGP